MKIIIRNETEKDYFEVETLTREAFWNVYMPGCDEHLVIHNLRNSSAFIKELDFVAEYNNKIVGNIVYSEGNIIGPYGKRTKCISFGPLSVLPEFQGKGIGKQLIEHSLNAAKQLGFNAVVITGSPDYYHKFGFKSASRFNIYLDADSHDDEAEFFMAKELYEGALKGLSGHYVFDEFFNVDSAELEEFEKLFPAKIKEVREGQLQ